MGKSIVMMASLILLFTIPASGQENLLKNHESGILVSALEADSETLNNKIEPKFVFGAFYNQFFSDLSWISSISYGSNTINDDCPQCSDTYYGKGHMTEIEISSGLRYTFLRGKRFFLKPFIESDLCYSSINYKGEFGGGSDGDGINIDFSNNTLGISGRLGLAFYPTSQSSLTVTSSMRYGTGRKTDRLDGSDENTKSLSIAFLEIRLGYCF